MSKHVLLFGVLCLPVVAHADTISSIQGETPAWAVNLTSGFTNTFQLILGDTFGKGPDFQDKLTVSLNNALANGDSVTMFGWSTTDLPSETPNWQAGLLYKASLLRRKNHALFLTAGGQRWVLPMVGSGTKDWFVTGNLTYGTSVKRIPIFVSEDSYSLLKSTLPTGSALYSQIYTQYVLLKRHGFQLALRQGPAYSYSWGLYGVYGNRVVRYGGSLIASREGNHARSRVSEAARTTGWDSQQRLLDVSPYAAAHQGASLSLCSSAARTGKARPLGPAGHLHRNGGRDPDGAQIPVKSTRIQSGATLRPEIGAEFFAHRLRPGSRS
jgi:hypothetical protein